MFRAAQHVPNNILICSLHMYVSCVHVCILLFLCCISSLCEWNWSVLSKWIFSRGALCAISDKTVKRTKIDMIFKQIEHLHLAIIMSFVKRDISTLMIENHTDSYLKMTKLKCVYFIPKVLKSWQFLSFWSHSWRSRASQCEIHRKSCNPELISDVIDYWSNQRSDWLRWCERPI